MVVAPEVGSEWADLQRNDEVLNINFQQLVARREAVRMSLAASGADGANRFQVLRPPVVPVLPIGPNRSLYLILAAAFAVLAGLAAAYLRGAMSGVFVSPRELEEAFQLPVIGTVSWEPAWDTGETKRSERPAVPIYASFGSGGCARPGCARLAQHAGSCSAWDGNRKQCGLGAAECYVSLKGGYDERQFTAPANVAGHRTRRR